LDVIAQLIYSTSIYAFKSDAQIIVNGPGLSGSLGDGVTLVDDVDLDPNSTHTSAVIICHHAHDNCFSQQKCREMVQLICLDVQLAVLRIVLASQMSYLLGLAAAIPR